MFLLLCAAEVKDLPIKKFYSQTDLDKKIYRIVGQMWMKNLYHLVQNNILEEVILHIEQRFLKNLKIQICWIV